MSAPGGPQARIPERIVCCPQCGGDSVFAPGNAYRPFCSERCRQIDLGAWASESFRVEAAPPEEGDPEPPAVRD